MTKVEELKIAVYDVLRKINQGQNAIKAWQKELERLDGEIIRLEQEDG